MIFVTKNTVTNSEKVFLVKKCSMIFFFLKNKHEKQFQKAIMKTLAKSGAKLAPGVGVGLSSLEAAGYSAQGRWTQAGIAALSGVVGEVPVAGDLVSAGLDLTNTTIDVLTGNIKPDIDEDTLYKNIGRKPRINL